MERNIPGVGRSGYPIQVVRCVILSSLLLVSFSTFPKTWIVDQKGSVRSIKSALEYASAGDTIRIMPGIYKEGNLLVRRSLTLMGIQYPVLDGENKYEILTIDANDVSIMGLKMINTGVGSMNDIAAVNAINS